MLNLTNLDPRTRLLMLDEIHQDVASGTLYLSPRLSDRGQADYPELLATAVQAHDEEWLAERLREQDLLNATEPRRKPKGGYTTARVPVTAADTLAEGEFNRFYARALCRRAILDGISDLVVYRAKE